MGTNYNDVYTKELLTFEPNIANFLGEIDCDEIYLDTFGGWVNGEYNSSKLKEGEEKMKLFYLADSWNN